MASIPIMLNLKGKQIVVVGGGNIAERKIITLLETEGMITVISPDVTPVIKQLHQQNKLLWLKKEFTPGDLDHAFLCVIAANHPKVNRVATLSAPEHALVNNVEDASQGNIQFPTHVKRGKLSIAISTNGASPTLAKKMKKDLEQTYDDRYEAYVDFLFEARSIIKKAPFSTTEKKQLLKQLVTDELLEKEKQTERLNLIYEQIKAARR